MTAGALAHVPVAIVECFIFNGILCGMSNLAAETSHFFLQWLLTLLYDILMRNFLTFFAFSAETLQTAQAMPMPLLSVFMAFGW